jgi:hypothetical protein
MASWALLVLKVSCNLMKGRVLISRSRIECSRYTDTLHHIKTLEITTAKSITRAAQAALLKKAKKHIKPGMNIIIRLQHNMDLESQQRQHRNFTSLQIRKKIGR